MFHVLYCFSLHFIPSQQSLNRFRIQPQTDIIALHDIPARCIMPYSMVTKTTTTKKNCIRAASPLGQSLDFTIHYLHSNMFRFVFVATEFTHSMSAFFIISLLRCSKTTTLPHVYIDLKAIRCVYVHDSIPLPNHNTHITDLHKHFFGRRRQCTTPDCIVSRFL